jgi:4-carboxymuconolactone decarboxylase
VDLVGLAGYYTLISMTLNVFAIEPPDGEPRELAQP